MKLNPDYLFDTRRRTSLKFSVSYEKDAIKDSQAKQLIKPLPNRTKLRENRYLKLDMCQKNINVSVNDFTLAVTSMCILLDPPSIKIQSKPYPTKRIVRRAKAVYCHAQTVALTQLPTR